VAAIVLTKGNAKMEFATAIKDILENFARK